MRFSTPDASSALEEFVETSGALLASKASPASNTAGNSGPDGGDRDTLCSNQPRCSRRLFFVIKSSWNGGPSLQPRAVASRACKRPVSVTTRTRKRFWGQEAWDVIRACAGIFPCKPVNPPRDASRSNVRRVVRCWPSCQGGEEKCELGGCFAM